MAQPNHPCQPTQTPLQIAPPSPREQPPLQLQPFSTTPSYSLVLTTAHWEPALIPSNYMHSHTPPRACREFGGWAGKLPGPKKEWPRSLPGRLAGRRTFQRCLLWGIIKAVALGRPHSTHRSGPNLFRTATSVGGPAPPPRITSDPVCAGSLPRLLQRCAVLTSWYAG